MTTRADSKKRSIAKTIVKGTKKADSKKGSTAKTTMKVTKRADSKLAAKRAMKRASKS